MGRLVQVSKLTAAHFEGEGEAVAVAYLLKPASWVLEVKTRQLTSVKVYSLK